MLTASNVRTLTCLLRHSSRRLINPVSSSVLHLRCYSAEEMRLPAADDAEKIYPQKIQTIVSDISKLSLLEVADLNELLKKTLNISEAPVMAMGAMPVGVQAQEEEVEEVKVQTNFTLRIKKFDETKKVALIKHVKTIMEGMNLVQAKKFVETLPAIVRKDAPKDEVEKLQDDLIAVGAECVID